MYTGKLKINYKIKNVDLNITIIMNNIYYYDVLFI